MSKMKTRGGPMSMQDGTTRGKKQESLTPRDVTEDKDKGGGVRQSRRKTGARKKSAWKPAEGLAPGRVLADICHSAVTRD